MPIADKFGRKRTFLISACAGNLVLFVTAWVNNYYVFIALRLLVGVFLQVGGLIAPLFDVTIVVWFGDCLVSFVLSARY